MPTLDTDGPFRWVDVFIDFGHFGASALQASTAFSIAELARELGRRGTGRPVETTSEPKLPPEQNSLLVGDSQ